MARVRQRPHGEPDPLDVARQALAGAQAAGSVVGTGFAQAAALIAIAESLRNLEEHGADHAPVPPAATVTPPVS